MGVEPSRSSIQDGSRYDDVGAVGWEMQTAGAVYVTHAVTRLQEVHIWEGLQSSSLSQGLGKYFILSWLGSCTCSTCWVLA